MRNYDMALTEKHQKYMYYHHLKLINTNILQVKKYYLMFKVKVWSKTSLLFLFRKSFRKKKAKTIKDKEEKNN